MPCVVYKGKSLVFSQMAQEEYPPYRLFAEYSQSSTRPVRHGSTVRVAILLATPLKLLLTMTVNCAPLSEAVGGGVV
jgi:hypothetical protein